MGWMYTYCRTVGGEGWVMVRLVEEVGETRREVNLERGIRFKGRRGW